MYFGTVYEWKTRDEVIIRHWYLNPCISFFRECRHNVISAHRKISKFAVNHDTSRPKTKACWRARFYYFLMDKQDDKSEAAKNRRAVRHRATFRKTIIIGQNEFRIDFFGQSAVSDIESRQKLGNCEVGISSILHIMSPATRSSSILCNHVYVSRYFLPMTRHRSRIHNAQRSL